MAEAPADPGKRGEARPPPGSTGHLEQKVLQVLRDASSPLKAHQLAKECQVPKKELNPVLYRMAKEGTVSQVAPATWRLGPGGPGGVDPTQPAQPSDAQKPPPEAAAVAESPGPQLSELEGRIHTFLKASEPCKALRIAKALGMRTAKDVNPTLYSMKSRRLLHQDQDQKVWRVSGPESRLHGLPERAERPHPHQDSEAIQMGHGNVLMKQKVSKDNVSATAALEASFEVRMPQSGPRPEADTAQRVHIKSCFLEDATIGNGNRMTVDPGAAAGPGDGQQAPGEPEERADPRSEADPSTPEDPPDGAQDAPRESALLAPRLGAMTLGGSSPHPAGRSA